MSLYLDLKYINLISNKLSLFKKKSNTTFNFRCPLCGDSQSKKTKARGYFYQNKNSMSMKCHNCAASLNFSSFLKSFDTLQYEQYSFEKFKETSDPSFKKPTEQKFVVDTSKFKPKILLDSLMPRLSSLPEDNPAVQYCKKREIPQEAFERLYFIDDIRKIENLTDKYKEKITTNEPRLVIPFYGKDKEFEGVSCRALGSEALRYITVKVKDDALMVFGIDAVNRNKKIYAVEGPLDSLFLPNSIAVGGVAFAKLYETDLPKERLVIILDNQPRNKEVCKQYKRYIDGGYKICIWPQTIQEKDINDMVIAFGNSEKVKKLIDANTFQGLEAELKFVSWKRC